MSFASWHDFYYAPWQQPAALLVAPFAFLVWRVLAAPPRGGAIPGAAPFVVAWSWIFGIETMLDPIATGPLAQAIGSAAASTALGLCFVLLGDFRIWWLVFGVAGPGKGLGVGPERQSSVPRREPQASEAGPAVRPALLATAAVPVFAWLATKALGLGLGPVPEQALWLVHESTFVVLAALVSRRRADPFVRAVLAYAAVYYGLWAASDALVLAGVDAGWLLRCVPNQLYYGLTVPFVWWRFFSPTHAATRSPLVSN